MELLSWARFINAEDREEFEMLSKENEYLKKAYKKLDVISADEKKRLEYEAREKAIRDYNHQMRSNWRQGHEQGFSEGEKSGFEKGQIETAAKFLDILDVETVAGRVGLPVETVLKIKESRTGK